MPAPARIKATHKAIKKYYATLEDYRGLYAEHEGATETAFQQLLAEAARSPGWSLVPKRPMKVGGKTIFPDGTVLDQFHLRRGYWEAKDTRDDLDAEIHKKIARGYPLANIIFEDTRQAVLFQGGAERARYDLSKPQQLADLLNDFFAYTEPDIEGFEEAVEEFKERVPELAQGLAAKMDEAHQSNKKFQAAFADFYALCQTNLNPNISQAAVDEMLVQHLLMERPFCKIDGGAVH